jgi:uncharacterized protein YjbJ (UPF0337 family)
VSGQDSDERTVGGLVGKVVGKAKEALGGATENDDLAREGRLQQVQSEAGLEAQKTAEQAREREARGALEERSAEVGAERDRLRAEAEAQEREEQIDRDRQVAQERAASQAASERAGADTQLQNETRQANDSVSDAERERIAAAEQSNRLEREAHEAERRASNLDPTEES